MSLSFILGCICSAAIGLSLGMIGGGGSILTVPVLVYVLDVPAHQAIGMSLAVVGATSTLGAFLHNRQNRVRLTTGIVFGTAGIPGAITGSRWTNLFTSSQLLLFFGILMIVVASLILVRKQADEGNDSHSRSLVRAMPAGFLVGILTGFLGVGGGFLIVPALVLFGGLSMKDAIGTSLVVIAMNCAAGLIGHLRREIFDLRIAAMVTVIALGGALAGTFFSHRISAHRLRKAFAMLVIGIGLFLIARNFQT